jgi:ABC-type transporter Mla MlaB component
MDLCRGRPRVPSRWHLPFADRGGMRPTLVNPLAFNHIRGEWRWLVECFLGECRAEDARSGNPMIRIETHQTVSHLTFKIAGKLCGASVRALEDCWKAAHQSSPALEQAVDLSDVSSIDKAGWCLLRHMHRDGVRLSATGLAGQTVLDELTARDELTCKEEKR